MKVGLCQINPTVGDFDGNRDKIVEAASRARIDGAELAVFSELASCGYPSDDLLLREGFVHASGRQLEDIAAHLPPDLPVLLGCLERNEEAAGRSLFNAVALLHDGLARVVARKSLLPTYDVFDEARFFEPWPDPARNVIEVAGTRIGITVCEDAWNDSEFFSSQRYHVDPVAEVVRAGADLVVNLSASPWNRRGTSGAGKHGFRLEMLAAASRRHGRPIVFVNQVGGNVGTQFDGGSTGVGPNGIAFDPVYFAASVRVVDTEADWHVEPSEHSIQWMQHAAICQGIRDYCQKFGFDKLVLGVSGGIDSALTAALAADAIGAENVTGIAMPSTFSSEHSVADAAALARNLGMPYQELPIGRLQEAFTETLAGVFAGTTPGVAEENLQARARGALLMGFSNKFGALLLTTGNKSECAVGYCTLYGDMSGALAPIADLWKSEVFALSRWINRAGERIPAHSIEKPPSAELRPDQFDTDSLPDYDVLDPVLRMLIEERSHVAEVAERTGMERERVAALFQQVQRSEFKRFQYAPTIRLTERCWDGRRVPVSHRFDER